MNRLQWTGGVVGAAAVLVAAALLFAPGLVATGEPLATLVAAMDAADPGTVVVTLSVVVGLVLTVASRRMTHTAPADVVRSGAGAAPHPRTGDRRSAGGSAPGDPSGAPAQDAPGGAPAPSDPAEAPVAAVFDGDPGVAPERVTDAGATQPALDRLVEAAIDADGDAPLAAVRGRLRRTAVDVYAQVHDAPAEVAREAVSTGAWTDDRVAAAFLGGEDGPTTPVGARLRRWLDPASERERRLRRTVDALSRLAGEEREP